MMLQHNAPSYKSLDVIEQVFLVSDQDQASYACKIIRPLSQTAWLEASHGLAILSTDQPIKKQY